MAWLHACCGKLRQQLQRRTLCRSGDPYRAGARRRRRHERCQCRLWVQARIERGTRPDLDNRFLRTISLPPHTVRQQPGVRLISLQSGSPPGAAIDLVRAARSDRPLCDDACEQERSGCRLSLVDRQSGRTASPGLPPQGELMGGLVECGSGIFGQLDRQLPGG